MKIAFVGKGKCGVSSMLALALTMYSEGDKSILLLDVGFARTSIEDAFRGDDNLYIKEESYYGIKEGMDYLLYRMKNGGYSSFLTKEGITFVTDNLAYIKCAIKGNKNDYEHQIEMYIKTMLNKWDREFDVVMIKCDDVFTRTVNEIMKNSDVCVACFEHENVIKHSELLYKISQKKSVYLLIGQVIGNCDKEKKILSNICRINEDKIGLVPFNSYFDMKLSTGGLLKLFTDKSSRKVSMDDFLQQMKIVLHKFRKWLEEIEYYG